MKKLMNSKSVMITSIISLCLSIIVLAAASMAWLSMNKETQSNGMQLKVEVTPNLIIDVSSSAIVAVTGPSESNFTVSFVDSAAAKEPATHDGDSATQLSYVTNASSVSPTTGLVKSGATPLTFSDATTRHYVDFIVYIASTEAAMTGQDLVATLAPAATIASSSGTDTLQAASIDFYLNGTYKGTLNVAGYDAATNNYTATQDSVVLLDNDTIPKNTEGYLTVLMRCYIDGALLKSAGQAFINTATVDTGDITLNVTFTATDN